MVVFPFVVVDLLAPTRQVNTTKRNDRDRGTDPPE
jgi:hypothetical protein